VVIIVFGRKRKTRFRSVFTQEPKPPVADPEIVGGVGCSRSRAAEGREGLGRGTPSPQERGLGRAPPQFFFNFGPQNGQFWCTVGAAGGMHPPHPPPGSATASH